MEILSYLTREFENFYLRMSRKNYQKIQHTTKEFHIITLRTCL